MRPSSLRRRLSGLAAAALLVATPALADWSAEATTKVVPQPGQKPPPATQGKVYGRKLMLRMDTQLPGQPANAPGMSILFDFEKRTGTTLMHAQKIASQRSLDELPMKLPMSCTGEGQDYDACFLAQGFKKTGTEKVNGHPSTVYEGTVPGMDGKPMRQKMWRPTGLPEVPYVRAQTFGADGNVMEINLTNIQQGAQPDSLFAVPPDYQKMDASPFEGKTPAQIQELIRQRMSQGAPPPQGGGKKP
ncbi:hypothetical protein [Pyxidicoccus trucidator]|uniref:hypothetical protein n=1 Tax=Pyxidicoccus trucidator TaxID=2709662 RepID=UPI0013DA7363|nr:hypothetical protein [Pyxidicoccus trucidator]